MIMTFHLLKTYGDKVKNWITLNEPGVFTDEGTAVNFLTEKIALKNCHFTAETRVQMG